MRLRWLLTAGLPCWLALLVGMLLGGVLTSTLAFHLWWCSYDNLSVDREMLSIVRVNEHIWARQQPSLQPLQEGECVCGADAERLRRAAVGATEVINEQTLEPVLRAFTHSTTAKPSPPEGTVSAQVSSKNSAGFQGYIQPSNKALMSQSQTPSEIVHLSGEYSLKKPLLVAVITSSKDLERAGAVYDTWGADVSQILFFVGEDCNTSHPAAVGLPIVRLQGTPDQPAGSVGKTFAVLRYLYENYAESFHWFMRIRDDAYVRGQKLERTLARLDPQERIYLGQAVTGKLRDKGKMLLQAHEHYCLGGPGVILSSGTLKALGPKLDYCLGAVDYYNSQGASDVWEYDDVELGRCVSRTLDVQCSQSSEAKTYFMHDYDNNPLTLKSIQSSLVDRDLVSYHPVPDATKMRALHIVFRQTDFQEAVGKMELTAGKVKEMCQASKLGDSGGRCEVAMCPSPQRCPNAGTVNVAPKSYPASTRLNYLSWEYFDPSELYSDKLQDPNLVFRSHSNRKHELQLALGKVAQAASEQNGRYVKFKRVVNGYVRHNPSRGNEYIIDAEYLDSRSGKIVETRVSLVRPLATNYITLQDASNAEATVNFIVPITNVNDRFKEFMAMYEDLCLKTNEKTNLILAVYGDSDVQFIKTVLTNYQKKYPRAGMEIVEGKGSFTRARALHLGMSRLRAEDLAFHCDVDMTIRQGFLNRCRRNTVQGQRVYYPEFFKLYNLKYVYRHSAPPSHLKIRRPHGHWAYYSFGMLCMYKSDYDSVGGMNTNIVGWGEEDVNFFEKVLRKKLEVLRAPDTALIHRWHEKRCSKKLVRKQYKHCLSSRAEHLADRMELANYIYELGLEIKPPSKAKNATYVADDLYEDTGPLEDIFDAAR